MDFHNEDFFIENQALLLEVMNTEVGRLLLAKLGSKPKSRIIKVTQNSFIELVDEEAGLYQATFYSRHPVATVFAPIIEKMKIVAHSKYLDLYLDNKYEAFVHYAGLEHSKKFPQIFLNTSTLNPVAGANSPCDGACLSNQSQPGISFSSLVAASGTSSSVTDVARNIIYLQSGSSGSGYVEIDRGILNFNTAPLTTTATISAASLNIYVNSTGNGFSGTPSIKIVTVTPAATNSIASSDYAQFGTTQQAALAISSLTTSAYNTFTTSNIASMINQTGVTSYGLRGDWDANNSFGGSYSNGQLLNVNINMADNGTNIPQLVVTFTLPIGFFPFL